MNNEEIIIENGTDTINEIINDSIVDNSNTENEEPITSNEESALESILLLLEEQFNSEEDSASEVETTSDAEDSTIDYTDILNDINDNLETIIINQGTIIENNQPHNIETAINDYSITEFLLLFAIIGGLLFICVNFIKNNVFHLR